MRKITPTEEDAQAFSFFSKQKNHRDLPDDFFCLSYLRNLALHHISCAAEVVRAGCKSDYVIAC